MTRPALRALTVLVALVLAAAAQTAEGGTAAGRSPHVLHVVDMNVECHTLAVDAAVKRTVVSHSPVLGLQEISVEQAAALRRAHPRWTVASHASRPSPVCAGHATSGEVAVYTGASRDVHVGSYRFRHQLTSGPGAPSSAGMACVTWDDVKHFCSVHLVAFNQAVAAAEAREVAYCTKSWVHAGDQVVVAGDFNAPPYSHFVGGRTVRDHTLDHLYRNDGRGSFYEVDAESVGPHKERAGPSTTDPTDRSAASRPGQPRKIDYVFINKDAWPGGLATTSRLELTRTGLSDHDLLYSTSLVQGATSSHYTHSLCPTLH